MSVYKLYNEGKVKLTLLLAPPRCVSTAIGMALAGSDDIDTYLVNPFYTGSLSGENDLDNFLASTIIPDSGFVHILIKEQLEAMSPQRFHSLKNICDNIIFITRDPAAQAFSAMRAYNAKSSGKRASQAEMQNVCNIYYSPDFRDEYLNKPWQRLKAFHSSLINDPETLAKTTVIDGDLFREYPNWHIAQLQRRTGLSLKSEHCKKWDSAKAKHGDTSHISENWIGRVTKTKSLGKSNQPAPEMHFFRPSMKKPVYGNYQIYEDLMRSPSFLIPNEMMAEVMLTTPVPRSSGQHTFSSICHGTTISTIKAIIDGHRQNEENGHVRI